MVEPSWCQNPRLLTVWRIIVDLIEERKSITTRSVYNASLGKNYGIEFRNISDVRFCLQQLEQYEYLCRETTHRGSVPIQWGLTLWGKHYLQNQSNTIASHIIALQDAIANERWEEGLVHAQTLIDTKGQDLDFLYFRGFCYKNLGEFEKAIKDFNITIENNYRFKESHKNRRYCYISLKRYEEALIDCLSFKAEDSSINDWSEQLEIRAFIINNCLELDDVEKGITYLTKAIKLDSFFAPYYFFLAIFHAQMGHQDSVVENLMKWIHYKDECNDFLIKPFCRETETSLPIRVFSEALGSKSLAFSYLDKAYELFIQKEVDLLNQYINQVDRSSDSEDKSREIEESSSRDKGYKVGKLLCERGDISQLLDQWDSALKYYHKGEECGYKDSTLYGRRGNVYEHLGEFEKASEDYRRYLNEALLSRDNELYTYCCSWLCKHLPEKHQLHQISQIKLNKLEEGSNQERIERGIIQEVSSQKIPPLPSEPNESLSHTVNRTEEFSQIEQSITTFTFCGIIASLVMLVIFSAF